MTSEHKVLRPRVLLVDDEPEWGDALGQQLLRRGFEPHVVRDADAALALLESREFDALVTDLRLERGDGVSLMVQAQELVPQLPTIVMTAYGAIDTAVEAIRRGAFHYLTKPFGVDELVLFLRRALDDRRLRRETGELRRRLHDAAPEGLVGRSTAMRAVFEVVARIADADVPVLLTGETGTGKTRIAAALHARSQRASAPFVAVNCAAIPEQLLESELFGHTRGAFTGATQASPGLFAEADQGTLFLDEIGELQPALQAKLLHVLERGVIRPVGGTRERRVNTRILAATNLDLDAAVRAGDFREDLYYRLALVVLEIPPLRDRCEDIPLLVEQCLESARRRHPTAAPRRIGDEVMAAFLAYRWPGNVRELGHLIERLVLLSRNEVIVPADLPRGFASEGPDAAAGGPGPFGGAVLPLRELQRRYARWAVAQNGGVKAHAARALGVDIKTLMKLLSE
ncbi:sigma-54 dependent transcriptional regulator [Nannocystis sp.]|uniref:sigma-54-dependent transcriptional regulator n=1 Tax=Nannocystis sp. TaxID=1962667 RepID=UPI002420959B|nr:sigma-54 dependent transcriptional regulator [Nannocystis sp.]MBK7825635.1 sigma-54-dependent Fis family transcriptional regulator [Nannocystis sp.]MBK9757155.1 sigma-54-dependent Fis family transcriptional regulator [Nannocystis sp.]